MKFRSGWARALERVGDGCIWAMAAVVVGAIVLWFYAILFASS